MSNLGVDLLRSDTGHYMQWPLDEGFGMSRAAASPGAPSAGGSARGRTWIANLSATAAANAATQRAAARAAEATLSAAEVRARVGVTVALVNWLFLLLLFCAFLLAATLPSSGSALTGGTAGQSCATPAAGCTSSTAR